MSWQVSTINASSTLASGKDQDMVSRYCTLVVTQEITLAAKGHLRTAGNRKGIKGSGLREGTGGRGCIYSGLATALSSGTLTKRGIPGNAPCDSVLIWGLKQGQLHASKCLNLCTFSLVPRAQADRLFS